jgi:hypothetical protein
VTVPTQNGSLVNFFHNFCHKLIAFLAITWGFDAATYGILMDFEVWIKQTWWLKLSKHGDVWIWVKSQEANPMRLISVGTMGQCYDAMICHMNVGETHRFCSIFQSTRVWIDFTFSFHPMNLGVEWSTWVFRLSISQTFRVWNTLELGFRSPTTCGAIGLFNFSDSHDHMTHFFEVILEAFLGCPWIAMLPGATEALRMDNKCTTGGEKALFLKPAVNLSWGWL